MTISCPAVIVSAEIAPQDSGMSMAWSADDVRERLGVGSQHVLSGALDKKGNPNRRDENRKPGAVSQRAIAEFFDYDSDERADEHRGEQHRRRARVSTVLRRTL